MCSIFEASPQSQLQHRSQQGVGAGPRRLVLLIKAASIPFTSAGKTLPECPHLWDTKRKHIMIRAHLSWQAAGPGTVPPAHGYKMFAETRTATTLLSPPSLPDCKASPRVLQKSRVKMLLNSHSRGFHFNMTCEISTSNLTHAARAQHLHSPRRLSWVWRCFMASLEC